MAAELDKGVNLFKIQDNLSIQRIAIYINGSKSFTGVAFSKKYQGFAIACSSYSDIYLLMVDEEIPSINIR